MPDILETLQSLYAVQVIDSAIQRAKKTQTGLDNGTAATVSAASAQAEAKQKLTTLHSLSGDLKDNELKLQTVETKRKNYHGKLYQGTVTNAKELANIEKEIEALGRQQSDLDGHILGLMDEVEEAQVASTVAEAAARAADGHRAEIIATYQSRYESLALELTDLIQHRAAAAARVEDPAALKRYDTIRAKAGGVGIAKIEGDTCGGCHLKLGSVQIKAVKELTQMQTCENCGRLLLAA